MAHADQKRALRGGVAAPIAWLVLAVASFCFSVLLSLASTGDAVNWYMWAALAVAAAALFLGVRGLVLVVGARRARSIQGSRVIREEES